MITEKRKLQLALLQIEQYDTKRYLSRSREAVSPELVKRMEWTGRLRVTSLLSRVLGVVGANVLVAGGMGVVEKVVWIWVKRRMRMLKLHGLQVVAIAGSYGKTSIKQYAYDILRTKYRVVATPESFNTVLGIAKCLYWEVDKNVDIFLVEMGAYREGEITRLLIMVQPDLGVLTGMARQHLERFGSYEAIKRAKGEIAVYMKMIDKPLVANGSNGYVHEVVSKIEGDVEWYEGKGRDEINLNGAKIVARMMGMKVREINRAEMRQAKNRFEMTTDRYGMRVIDDSYSSNDVGFLDAVKHLGKQKKYTRILVTPGLVELGSESVRIHEELGRQIVGNADIVILVGGGERVQSLERGIAGQVKVLRVNKTLEFVQVVKSLKVKKDPLVLLENDVTENYNS